MIGCFKQKVTNIKCLLIGINLMFCISVFGQQFSIGTPLPNPNTDLTLGSEDKGVLLNRVKLVNLTSALPLDEKYIQPGMLVYNTTIDDNLSLNEGFYYWTSEKKWSRMYVKTIPTREMDFAIFKETKRSYVAPYSTDTKPAYVDITDLDVDYTAKSSGEVFVELTLYATLEGHSKKAANTFCYITVVDNMNNIVYKGSTALSPYQYQNKKDNLPVQGFSNFVFPIEKGKTYKIRSKVNEVYVDSSYIVSVGDFENPNEGIKLHSSIKITYLTQPKL